MARTVGVSAAAVGSISSQYHANFSVHVDPFKRVSGLGEGSGAKTLPCPPEGPRLMIPNYGAAKHSNGTRTFREEEGEGDERLEEEDLEGGVWGQLSPSYYRQKFQLYSVVPITATLTILFFTLLQRFLWPSQNTPYPVGSYVALAILGAAVWTVSFALRIPLYLLSTNICRRIPVSTPFVSAALQVFVEESLRLASLVLAQIHVKNCVTWGDSAFSLVWTLALGWAAAEVMVSVSQGYAQLSLYGDVVVDKDFPSAQPIRTPHGLEGQATPAQILYQLENEADESFNEAFDQLLRARARVELEALYGIPVPQIPVFISCLLRIDSIMLSIALFLIISAAYLSSLSHPFDAEHPSQAIQDIIPIFVLVYVLHTILGFVWMPHILPRIGLHVASYISCIVALGMLFVGLARWDAI
ncbi:hypothetical protein BU17DRAFT_101364 [Hysterangium stoloniferum]|nr:hypothetical protein BU17DRAFT_101364 [Hysterangium stoloniferum]